MSIAYQCDNCLECYPGYPHYKSDDGHHDLCPDCVRVMTAFKNIDPFDIHPNQKKEDTVTTKE